MRDDDIELRHLRSFVSVATKLNFSRAAEELHLTQQSLSAQIQQLEKRLGVVLLERTTRRVELTEAGSALLDEATSALAGIAAGLDRVRRVAHGEVGQLRVSFTPTIAYETLPALLEEASLRAPALTLQVSEMWQAESVEAIRAGRLDVGLARHPELPDELDSVRIRDEPMGAVFGVSHPLAHEDTFSAADLGDSALVIWPRRFSPAFFDQVVDNYRAGGFHGDIVEMHMLTRGSFLQDPAGRRMIESGNAFSVAFEHEHDPMPEGFVWRPVLAGPTIAVHMYWRRPASATGRRLVGIAEQLAEKRGWQTAD